MRVTTSALLAVSFLFLLSCSVPAIKPPYPAIDGNALKTHIEKLADIEKEGRTPGSRGEQLANSYVSDAFRAMGYKVQNQPVPVAELTFDETPLKITGAKSALTLKFGDDFVAWTRQVRDIISVDAELVFVGYGIVAPEYSWNDFKDVDVRGKILVVMIGTPHEGSRDMMGLMGPTYYGRPLYKFEEAARQGAAGALIVHEPEQAGVSWDDVRKLASQKMYEIDEPDKEAKTVPLEGWMTDKAAAQLSGNAAIDFEELKKSAEQTNFEPVPLGLKASIEIKSTRSSFHSNTVVALLEGQTQEYVIYAAHWNHVNSVRLIGGAAAPKESLNDPTGVPAMLEIARALKAERRRKRSVVFLIVTAEDEGLLGSKYYAENPLYPLEKTLAYINLDGSEVHRLNRYIYVIGNAYEALQDLLKQAASERDRILGTAQDREKIYYYRFSQFSWTKNGIPTLYVTSINDSENRAQDAQPQHAQPRDVQPQHAQPQDVQPQHAQPQDVSLNIVGAVYDAQLLFDVGLNVVNAGHWPKWKPVESPAIPRAPVSN